MSLAAEAIADLDAELRETGQDVEIVRPVKGGTEIRRPVRAFVRGYTPDELLGGLQQGDTQLVLSPTGLPTEFADADATRLRRNDQIAFDGRLRNVQFIEPVRVAGVLVRMNVVVRG